MNKSNKVQAEDSLKGEQDGLIPANIVGLPTDDQLNEMYQGLGLSTTIRFLQRRAQTLLDEQTALVGKYREALEPFARSWELDVAISASDGINPEADTQCYDREYTKHSDFKKASEVLQTSPQEALSQLKSRIRKEVIGECVEAVEGVLYEGGKGHSRHYGWLNGKGDSIEALQALQKDQ